MRFVRARMSDLKMTDNTYPTSYDSSEFDLSLFTTEQAMNSAICSRPVCSACFDIRLACLVDNNALH